MKTLKNQEGFSYIDTLVAITIMLVGVLALVAAVTASVVNSRSNERNLIAKQHVASTLEAIFSARDLGVTLGWDSIGNVGSNPDPDTGVARGVFVVGRQTMRPNDGADHIPGTNDDTGTPMIGFDRQIVITDICDPERPSANCSPAGANPVMMRKVEVTIWYQVTGGWRQEQTSTIVTNSTTVQ